MPNRSPIAALAVLGSALLTPALARAAVVERAELGASGGPAFFGAGGQGSTTLGAGAITGAIGLRFDEIAALYARPIVVFSGGASGLQGRLFAPLLVEGRFAMGWHVAVGPSLDVTPEGNGIAAHVGAHVRLGTCIFAMPGPCYAGTDAIAPVQVAVSLDGDLHATLREGGIDVWPMLGLTVHFWR